MNNEYDCLRQIICGDLVTSAAPSATVPDAYYQIAHSAADSVNRVNYGADPKNGDVVSQVMWTAFSFSHSFESVIDIFEYGGVRMLPGFGNNRTRTENFGRIFENEVGRKMLGYRYVSRFNHKLVPIPVETRAYMRATKNSHFVFNLEESDVPQSEYKILSQVKAAKYGLPIYNPNSHSADIGASLKRAKAARLALLKDPQKTYWDHPELIGHVYPQIWEIVREPQNVGNNYIQRVNKNDRFKDYKTSITAESIVAAIDKDHVNFLDDWFHAALTYAIIENPIYSDSFSYSMMSIAAGLYDVLESINLPPQMRRDQANFHKRQIVDKLMMAHGYKVPSKL